MAKWYVGGRDWIGGTGRFWKKEDAGAWTEVPLPGGVPDYTTYSVEAIWALRDDFVLLSMYKEGTFPQIAIYDGVSVTPWYQGWSGLPPSRWICNSIVGFSETSIFFVTEDHLDSAPGQVYEWDGVSMTSIRTSDFADSGQYGIDGVSASDLWVLQYGYARSYHYDGATWGLEVPVGTVGSFSENSILPVATDEVYAPESGGGLRVQRWDGADWASFYDGSAELGGTPHVVFGTGSDDLFVAGDGDGTRGIVHHFDGASWNVIELEEGATSGIRSAFAVAETEALVNGAGAVGRVWAFNGYDFVKTEIAANLVVNAIAGLPSGPGDFAPPFLRDLAPAENEGGVPVNAVVDVTISDLGTGVDEPTVRIDFGGVPVWSAGAEQPGFSVRKLIGTDGPLYEITPDANLAFATSFDVRVRADDVAGNSLDRTYSFETQHEAPADLPEVWLIGRDANHDPAVFKINTAGVAWSLEKEFSQKLPGSLTGDLGLANPNPLTGYTFVSSRRDVVSPAAFACRKPDGSWVDLVDRCGYPPGIAYDGNWGWEGAALSAIYGLTEDHFYVGGRLREVWDVDNTREDLHDLSDPKLYARWKMDQESDGSEEILEPDYGPNGFFAYPNFVSGAYGPWGARHGWCPSRDPGILLGKPTRDMRYPWGMITDDVRTLGQRTDHTTFKHQAWTLSFWFWLGSDPIEDVLIGPEVQLVSKLGAWQTFLSLSGGTWYVGGSNNTQTGLWGPHQFLIDPRSGDHARVRGYAQPATPAQGTTFWHHVVYTFVGGTARLWHNARLVGEEIDARYTDQLGTANAVTFNGGGVQSSLDMKMSDVAYYTEAKDFDWIYNEFGKVVPGAKGAIWAWDGEDWDRTFSKGPATNAYATEGSGIVYLVPYYSDGEAVEDIQGAGDDRFSFFSAHSNGRVMKYIRGAIVELVAISTSHGLDAFVRQGAAPNEFWAYEGQQLQVYDGATLSEEPYSPTRLSPGGYAHAFSIDEIIGVRASTTIVRLGWDVDGVVLHTPTAGSVEPVVAVLGDTIVAISAYPQTISYSHDRGATWTEFEFTDAMAAAGGGGASGVFIPIPLPPGVVPTDPAANAVGVDVDGMIRFRVIVRAALDEPWTIGVHRGGGWALALSYDGAAAFAPDFSGEESLLEVTDEGYLVTIDPVEPFDIERVVFVGFAIKDYLGNPAELEEE